MAILWGQSGYLGNVDTMIWRDTAFLQQIFNHQKIKAHFDHFGSLRALAIITG